MTLVGVPQTTGTITVNGKDSSFLALVPGASDSCATMEGSPQMNRAEGIGCGVGCRAPVCLSWTTGALRGSPPRATAPPPFSSLLPSPPAASGSPSVSFPVQTPLLDLPVLHSLSLSVSRACHTQCVPTHHPHVAPAPWSHPRDPGPVPGQAPGVILDCSCLPLTPLTLLPVLSTPSAPPPSLGLVTEASGLVFLPSSFPWCGLVTCPQRRPLGWKQSSLHCAPRQGSLSHSGCVAGPRASGQAWRARPGHVACFPPLARAVPLQGGLEAWLRCPCGAHLALPSLHRGSPSFTSCPPWPVGPLLASRIWLSWLDPHTWHIVGL